MCFYLNYAKIDSNFDLSGLNCVVIQMYLILKHRAMHVLYWLQVLELRSLFTISISIVCGLWMLCHTPTVDDH